MLFTRAVRLSVLVPRCFRDYVENEDVVVVLTLLGTEEYAGDVPCQSVYRENISLAAIFSIRAYDLAVLFGL